MALDALILSTLPENEAEAELENWAERATDRIDRSYCAGRLSTDEYQAAMRGIGETVERLWQEQERLRAPRGWRVAEA